MSLPAPTARGRFAAMVTRPEPEVDLATAALLIAAEEYPQLVPEPYLRRLDELAERVRDRQWDATAPVVVLQDLSRVLFEEEGFRGNTDSYYDPRNSFLNDVLDRRLGIPITLSVLYLEVGWRLGLPLHGVNFPGHFLVRYDGEALKLLVDPFQHGRIRFEDEAQELLDHVYGGSVRMQPDFLRPADRKDILVRMLENLKGTYLNARDDARGLAALERILLITPDSPDHVRDRGMVLTRMGRGREAAEALSRYLDLVPDAPDRVRVQLLLGQLNDND
ncbi:MAG TPA: transglutaminase-like domain-containing protein [Longimicrobiales bacterium]|nr:transglutaminase-like domain-containing protein [Longimicrobiales bacterium]